jgi:predicted transcriptional regulator
MYVSPNRPKIMVETARKKQNITISLSAEVIKKAKVLAAQRSTSISGLLAEQIESLIGREEAYERSQRAALALLEKGFHLGGMITADRDELHQR